jgi:dinuclear metal center YbgI/SA1388 family protein
MATTVAQIVKLIDELAPSNLAASWDNVGLQIGSRGWPVNKVWTALDPLPEVVAKACANEVDLLVTHHPLFFKPLKRIDCESTAGRIIELALTAKLAVFCAHTNLDSVAGGINDILAERMGVAQLRVLDTPPDANVSKLVVFTPETHVRAVMDALFAAGGGRIGNYSGCSFRSAGTGSFLPGEEARPFVGEVGALNEVAESRIEVLIPNHKLDRLVAAAQKVHPYETMAHDVYPLNARDDRQGLGRVGSLAAPILLKDFSKKLKTALNLKMVKITGAADKSIRTVALCSGSGGSLLPAAIASGADAYVSGDLGYHTARDAQQAGIALVDAGHFGSEHIIVDALASMLRKAVDAKGLQVGVEACDMETDPFHYL